MTIAKDTVVTMHYTLRGDDGETIDSSAGGEPLEYLHGNGYLLPRLEEQLEGKAPGDTLETVLSAADGYGEYDEHLVAEVPRDSFDTAVDIEEGMRFHAETDAGPQIVRVTKVGDDTITVDGNHELAGRTLHFSVEVLDVRAATDDELQNGLGGGCCGCGGECGGCGEGCGGGGCAGGCGGCL